MKHVSRQAFPRPLENQKKKLGWAGLGLPLKIVRPRILVLLLGTEGTHVAGGLVDEAMADHLVFALEALAAEASRAARDRAVVGSAGGVNVGVGGEEILGLEG